MIVNKTNVHRRIKAVVGIFFKVSPGEKAYPASPFTKSEEL